MVPPETMLDQVAAEAGRIDGEGAAAGLPLEVLERKLIGHAARLAAEQARWLGWLADYDAREGWREWGCLSAAHWLSWKCGITGSAARERVRVARALTDLSLIAAEFRAGVLSWSKVRAMTRVANVDNEADLVAIAIEATGAQLERICRAMRPLDDHDYSPAAAFASRGWSKRRNFDGTATYTLRVTDDAAADIDTHLERQVTTIIDDATSGDLRRRDVIADRGGIAAIRADAATELLAGTSELTTPTPSPVQLVIDPDTHHQHTTAVSAGTPVEQAAKPASEVSATTATGANTLDNEANRRNVAAETDTRADAANNHANPRDVSAGTGTNHDAANNHANPRSVSAETPTTDDPANNHANPRDVSAGTGTNDDPADTHANRRSVSAGTGTNDDPANNNANRRSVSAETGPDGVTYLDAAGRQIPDTVGHRLCCDPRITPILQSALRSSISVGRTTRLIPTPMRIALHHRDHHTCQFPGCTANRHLHAHHIIHWANGGPTELDNLILVCHYHHHLVHDTGWTIDPTTRTFHHPTGQPAPPTPDIARYNASLDRIEPDITTLEPLPNPPTPPIATHDPLDLAWITSIIGHNETINRTNRLADEPAQRPDWPDIN